MNYKISFITLTIIATLFLMFVPLAYAQEDGGASSDGMKFLGAGIAFAGATLGAGMAIGRAGSASLAAAAENENLRYDHYCTCRSRCYLWNSCRSINLGKLR